MSLSYWLGFLYRDLKPENLLLDGEGYCKITDFGLAKDLGINCESLRTYTACGTLDYYSPEIYVKLKKMLLIDS